MINETTEKVVLRKLLEENSTKSKTKYLKYEKLEMRQYLRENLNTKVSKIIFNIRAETLDIKTWNHWNYEDNLCIMCNVKEETIEHFMKCETYGTEQIKFEDIYSNDGERQFEIGKQALKRHKERKNKKEEDGQASFPAPTAPDSPLFS